VCLGLNLNQETGRLLVMKIHLDAWVTVYALVIAGAISGTPTQLVQQSGFTITGINTGGQAKVKVKISVIGSVAPTPAPTSSPTPPPTVHTGPSLAGAIGKMKPGWCTNCLGLQVCYATFASVSNTMDSSIQGLVPGTCCNTNI
jgi:hypothetical protein